MDITTGIIGVAAILVGIYTLYLRARAQRSLESWPRWRRNLETVSAMPYTSLRTLIPLAAGALQCRARAAVPGPARRLAPRSGALHRRVVDL